MFLFPNQSQAVRPTALQWLLDRFGAISKNEVERPCLLPPGFGAPGPALPRPSNAPNDAQHEAIVHRRELRRAALLKRQVAGMEASPSMLTPAAAEVRDSILAAGPDTAPSSSFEEVPSHKSCYFGPLLDEHIQLFKPT